MRGEGAGVAHGERRRVPAEDAPEPGHARRAGIVGERRRPASPATPAAPAVEHDGAVGERRGALEAVLGEQDGGAEVGVEPRDRGEHVVGALRVELRRRLVEHERGRRGGERTGDRGPLALAARQRRR